MAGAFDRSCYRTYVIVIASVLFAGYFVVNVSALKPCRSSDFGSLIFPCNVNWTRSIVPFMRQQCDATANGSYVPRVIDNLPCLCEPGKGIEITIRGSFSWRCEPCKPGNYSVGGTVIDTWERWNGSLNVPGSGYRFTPYCTTVMKDGFCNGWQPSHDFSHLVSSPVVNATDPTTCLENKNMQTYMAFHNTGDKENYISFRYKVDGVPCPKKGSDCRKGLMFYVDDKLVLKVDVKFSWHTFKYNLTAGTHLFRWKHISSCSRRAGFFDVAYIAHVTFVGVKKHSKCNPCPEGTFSNKMGSTECTKCPYGTYQNKPGQTKCLKCPTNEFSHIGDKTCFRLNKCMESDYRFVPDPIGKCYIKDGMPVRNQAVLTPKWPGIGSGACISEAKPSKITNCTCPSGSFLRQRHIPDADTDTFYCDVCDAGKVFNEKGECVRCKNNMAAIPGFLVDEWPNGPIPSEFTTACSGDGCKDGGWINHGNSISTKRIPGNFETYLQLKNLNINYYRAFIRFNCSVDCRINPATNKLARPSDCFLRFSLIRDGLLTVRDVDCIRFGRDHMRNGTIMNHYYPITIPGNYTMRWTFHQNDDESTNILSYEARIYTVVILGLENGKVRGCKKCSRGSEVTSDGTSCQKCPVGTFSSDGVMCKPCPKGTFTDKVESRECIKCGANTKPNAARTDCLINNCRFNAYPGITYDLMPMSNVGGPMVEVQQAPKTGSHVWYRHIFYVNLCTRSHDNSSCTDLQQRADESGKYVRETVILKTMACKRWSFSSTYSYNIGRVIGFKAKPDVTTGLTVELTDGFRCYNKHKNEMKKAKTILDLVCDPQAGVGKPTSMRNESVVEKQPCEFFVQWRSLYACPICNTTKAVEVHTDCVNGYKNVTYKFPNNCRNQVGGTRPYDKLFVPCEKAGQTVIRKSFSPVSLIVMVVIFVLIAIALFVTVILLLRRNRLYRTQLFAPTHMKQLDDDLHELIDD